MDGLLNEFSRVRQSFKEQIHDLVSGQTVNVSSRIDTLFRFITEEFFKDPDSGVDLNNEAYKLMQKKRLE